eukprot:7954717-Alexandrium_andersonii.AAC.1
MRSIAACGMLSRISRAKRRASSFVQPGDLPWRRDRHSGSGDPHGTIDIVQGCIWQAQMPVV